jgi:hypothetical protein
VTLGAAYREKFGADTLGLPAPDEWDLWLETLFARYVGAGFAYRHQEFWEWVWAIEQESKPDPFLGVWPRGGGKTTSAELAVAGVGLRGKRKYVLYVRGTQARADDSVGNIARLFERPEVATYYPLHAQRAVNKYGNSQGWRRERMSTAGGFTVDAIGMDTVARGVKLDDQRPDLIVFDDIDEKTDTAAITAKKINTLTTSLLPAGAPNVGVLGIQNLIIPDGIFTRLVDGRADFLTRRIVSGPFPAVEGLEVEPEIDPESGTRRYTIVAGEPTWAGQDLTTCQAQIDEWGYEAFKKEAQHQVTDRSEGLALRVTPEHYESIDDDAARKLVTKGRVFGGIDFGHWRFAFVLRAIDTVGKVREIAHYFNQRDGLEVRARALIAICRHYGVPETIRFRGDAANPTDILELNNAFKRLGSKLRVLAVAQENKARKASVEKINDLLDRAALSYRRDAHRAVAAILAEEFKRPAEEYLTWRHGYNASSAGVEMTEPRLHWEVAHWSYPVPKEGVPQNQDPDDATADGADEIAADRYGVMSALRPAKQEEAPDSDEITPSMRAAEEERQRRIDWRKKQRRQRPSDPNFGEY